MLKNPFRKLGLRISVSLLRLSQNFGSGDDKAVRSPFEKEGLVNCRKLIRDPRSELFICPITKKRYVKNVDLSIFIVISSHSMDWVNHTYYYPILISPIGYRKIGRVFDNNVAKRRELMEKEILTNVQSSLTQIFTKINV